MYSWLLLQIYLCYLWLLLCSRVTQVDVMVIQACLVSPQGHTYVNTTGLLEQHSPSVREVPAELNISLSDGEEEAPDPGPRVQLEPEGARFVLGPTPVQRQRQREASVSGQQCAGSSSAQNSNGSVLSHTDASDSTRSEETSPGAPESFTVCRRRPPLTPDANVNNSAQRRTALLDYENLPALPPLREHPKGGSEDEAVNGFHSHRQHSPDPTHYYINTENVIVPFSANKLESARWRDRSTPSFFNFDFRRPCLESHRLNYIEVETETENSSNPQTPKTPTSPLPQTPTRRTELYAVIDVERTAAMSNLQKALPRYDGTSRKTRHNSVDLPMWTLLKLPQFNPIEVDLVLGLQGGGNIPKIHGRFRKKKWNVSTIYGMFLKLTWNYFHIFATLCWY